MILQLAAGIALMLIFWFAAHGPMTRWLERRAEKWREERIAAGRPVPPKEGTWYQRAIVIVSIVLLPILFVTSALIERWFMASSAGTLSVLVAAKFLRERLLERDL